MSQNTPEIRLVICGTFSGTTPPPKYQLLVIDRIHDPKSNSRSPDMRISFREMPCWIYADTPEQALEAGKAEFPFFRRRLAVEPRYV